MTAAQALDEAAEVLAPTFAQRRADAIGVVAK